MSHCGKGAAAVAMLLSAVCCVDAFALSLSPAPALGRARAHPSSLYHSPFGPLAIEAPLGGRRGARHLPPVQTTRLPERSAAAGMIMDAHRMGLGAARRDGGGACPWPRSSAVSRGSHISRRLSSSSSSSQQPSEYIDMQGTLYERFQVLPDTAETPLMLAVTQDTGRCDLGFIATSDIARGDTLVSVPWSLALAVDAAEKKNSAPSDLRLALLLLQTLGHIGGSEEDDERSEAWKHYSKSVLPSVHEKSGANAGVLWCDADVEELQFEGAVEDIKALKNHVDEQVQRYIDDGGESDAAHLRWALGIVRGRSFLVDGVDGKRKYRALVPVADLFNHMPESPSTWAAASGGDDEGSNPWLMIEGDDGLLYLDIIAHKDWAKGEEVLLPYGLETSSELLASHGIILPHNEADYLPIYQDLVELVGDVSEIELGESVDVARGKLEALQDLDAAEAPLAARPGVGSHDIGSSKHLIGCLEVAYASTEELGMFEEDFDPDVGHYTIRPRVGVDGMKPERARELRSLALRKAASVCDDLLAKLPTTLQQDRDVLFSLMEAEGGQGEGVGTADGGGDGEDGGGSGSRVAHKRLAVQYRITAKDLLSDFRTRCLENL